MLAYPILSTNETLLPMSNDRTLVRSAELKTTLKFHFMAHKSPDACGCDMKLKTPRTDAVPESHCRDNDFQAANVGTVRRVPSA
jgi:hypothetical protein